MVDQDVRIGMGIGRSASACPAFGQFTEMAHKKEREFVNAPACERERWWGALGEYRSVISVIRQ